MVRLISFLWYWLRLRSGNPEVRAASAEMLGKLGSRRSVASLVKALEDPETMREAAEALGEIGDARAVKPLIKTLIEVPESVVWYLGEALGKIGESAVEPLIQFLGSASGQSKMAAVDALGEIGDQRAVIPLIGLLKHGSYAAVRALGKIGDPRAIPHLINVMGEGGDLAERACDAIAHFGTRAVPALVDALKSSVVEQRRYAVQALGQIAPPEATQLLLERLNDKDNIVRVEAIHSLDKIGDRIAVTPLIGLLSDRDSEVAGTAAEALGTLGDKAAVEPLVRILREGRLPVGYLFDVAQALDSLGWRPSDPEDKARYYIARRRWKEVAVLGKPAIDCIVDVLQRVPPHVRTKAVETLGNIKDKAAVEPLVGLLGDRDDEVRKAATKALHKLGWEPSGSAKRIKYYAARGDWDKLVDLGEKSVKTLVRLLNDREGLTEENWRIIRALGEIGDSRAVGPLIDFTRRWVLDTSHRRDIWNALVKIGEPSAKRLIELLDSPHRKEIERSLVQMGPAAVDALVEALAEKNDAIRARAANALRKIGKPAVGPLSDAKNSKDARVRKLAAEILQKIRQ